MTVCDVPSTFAVRTALRSNQGSRSERHPWLEPFVYAKACACMCVRARGGRGKTHKLSHTHTYTQDMREKGECVERRGGEGRRLALPPSLKPERGNIGAA